MEWFEFSLLPYLHERCIVILDNVKYNKCKPVDTLNAKKMKKKHVLSELERVQVEYDPNITSIEAKTLLRE